MHCKCYLIKETNHESRVRNSDTAPREKVLRRMEYEQWEVDRFYAKKKKKKSGKIRGAWVAQLSA